MQNRYNIEALSREPVSRARLETAPLANAPLRAAASNPPGPPWGGPSGDTVTGDWSRLGIEIYSGFRGGPVVQPAGERRLSRAGRAGG